MARDVSLECYIVLRFRLLSKSLKMMVLASSGLSICMLKSPTRSSLFFMDPMLFSSIDSNSSQNCDTLVLGMR